MQVKARFHPVPVIFLAIIILLLAGCDLLQPPQNNPAAPTAQVDALVATPTPFQAGSQSADYGPLCKINLAHISLPDGSEVYLMPRAELDFTLAEASGDSTQGFDLLLKRGQIIVVSQQAAGTWLTVTNPQGFLARLDGLIMLIEYAPETGEFGATCISGICQIGPSLDSLEFITNLYTGMLDTEGTFLGAMAVDLNSLSLGCGEDFVSELDYATPVPEIDLDATATAFCGEYEEANPGTPCPE